MAFNVLSGTVYLPGELLSDGQVSGSIFIGDGQSLLNIPRVTSNPTTDNLLTVGATANSLVGEPNLTFDGTTLTLAGTLTASVNISASAFYGDGSNLAGVGIAVVSGSSTVSSVSSINFTKVGTLTDVGSGIVALTGTIGPAEDGSYTDGLYTDFTEATTVGSAVDRFNEVLKALAPGPAPSLDDVNCADTGTSAVLSFGASQAISGYTDVGTAAGFSAVDINGTYSVTTSGNNLRRAVFDGTTVINGTLNADVSSDGSYPNYPAYSFGDADQGHVVLEVNGSTLQAASLTSSGTGTGVPGSGTGTDLNGNGSGFYDLSQTASAHFTDGTELSVFQHRTGYYKVTAADQRDGWNYLLIRHSSSTFNRTTNYVEWVNDSDSNALAASGGTLDTLAMTGDLRLSGVKYHVGGTAEYRVVVDNAYRDVYSTSTISYTDTNVTVPTQAFPSISVGAETETKKLHLTGAATVNASSILNSSMTVGVDVPAPLKSNLSNAQPVSISGLLMYNRTNNSSTTSETFRRENYRIDSGAYAAQADLIDAGNTWDSSGSLSSNDGLLFYNQRLYSPTDGDIPNSGDFSTITNGPASNADYSSITGARTFFRYFTSTGAASQTNFELAFSGDSSTKIVPGSTALTAAKIHVFIKLPTTSTGKATGWLDLGIASANDENQLSDGDGCFVGSVPAAGHSINGGTHEGTFVTQTIEQNENIGIKIVADAAWTGYISALSITWGGS
jgi:hypothetical protein